MNNLTMGIIYAIKRSGKSTREAIADFLSERTMTPKEYYTDKELVRIVRNTFIDYLRTADNPAFDVSQYFDIKRQKEAYKEFFPIMEKQYAERDNLLDIDTESIAAALRLCNVVENGEYVNGFKD